MKNNQNTLLELRSEIDKIDDQLISLINNRVKTVAKVGAYKNSINEKIFIKSAREADMIKNLLLKADKSIPQEAIVSIWRKIIATANVLEQDLKIALHNPNKISDYGHLIKEYYGGFVEVVNKNTTACVIKALEENTAQIGVFCLPNKRDAKNYINQNWWIDFAKNSSNINIFAQIPFLQYQDKAPCEHHLVIAAIKEPEKSQDDKTLLLVELNEEFSKESLGFEINKLELNVEIFKSTKGSDNDKNISYLLAIDGFFKDGDSQLKALEQSRIKPFVKVIGHYPTQIIIK